jgi:hypothetical protein
MPGEASSVESVVDVMAQVSTEDITINREHVWRHDLPPDIPPEAAWMTIDEVDV